MALNHNRAHCGSACSSHGIYRTAAEYRIAQRSPRLQNGYLILLIGLDALGAHPEVVLPACRPRHLQLTGCPEAPALFEKECLDSSPAGTDHRRHTLRYGLDSRAVAAFSGRRRSKSPYALRRPRCGEHPARIVRTDAVCDPNE